MNHPRRSPRALVAALLLGACGPNAAEKGAALDEFCAVPKPLPWAPASHDVVVYMLDHDPALGPQRWSDISSAYFASAAASD